MGKDSASGTLGQRYYLQQSRHTYAATQDQSGEYRLKIPYRSDEELDKAVQDLLQHIAFEADLRNCFSESDATLEGSDHKNW